MAFLKFERTPNIWSSCHCVCQRIASSVLHSPPPYHSNKNNPKLLGQIQTYPATPLDLPTETLCHPDIVAWSRHHSRRRKHIYVHISRAKHHTTLYKYVVLVFVVSVCAHLVCGIIAATLYSTELPDDA